MAAAKKKAAKGRKISVDMTDVEGGSRMEDGDYIAKVVEVTQEESEGGNDYLKWKLKTTDGKTLYHNTSLQPQALWNLRNTLEACGLEVPQKSIDVDLDDLTDLDLGVSVENEIYQGKKRARVVDVFPATEAEAEEGEEEEEEEKPAAKPAKKSAKKSEPEPEEEEEEEEPAEEEAEEEEAEGDELDGLDRNALKKKLAELESDFVVKKSTTDDEIREAIRAASGEAEEPEEEAEEEEEEEPEEETKPAPKKKGGKVAFAVGDKVTFTDEGKKLSGKVAKINEKEGFCEVTVGKEAWEIEFKDLAK